MVFDRLLPLRAPLRRVFGKQHLLNGSAAGLEHSDITAADEAERSVIEMIAVQVVDNLTARAGADEGAHRPVLIEEHQDAANILIGIVAPDNPPACSRDVR